MTQQNFRETAAFIWSIADLLRGNFKQSQYGRIILPFTVLRRLELVLAPTKEDVLEASRELEAERAKWIKETGEDLDSNYVNMILTSAANASFYNTSPMDLTKLGQGDIRANLANYIAAFSPAAREIFDHFRFEEFTSLLDDVDLLEDVIEAFSKVNISPVDFDNQQMSIIFEDLIRQFSESSNETAGEHFTPRDIAYLISRLTIKKEAFLNEYTIYDPTAGTGGFLFSGMEYVHDFSPKARLTAFGQELNPESYAICQANMLIRNQSINNIKLGNTLNNDQLIHKKFNYMLSNPPFGVDWKGVQNEIEDEHHTKGFNGRFGPGLPRVSDGSLLFLLHLISKMDEPSPHSTGGRIGIILNGSPLFTGNAGSGESEIRRYILEHDLLEAIVALPNDMFYNTGIATYIWILSNNKEPARRGHVQLINGENLYQRMRKSLGSKRNEITKTQAESILSDYARFDKADSIDPETGEKLTKILPNYAFGYRRVTIDRPLRLSAQFTPERLDGLRFSPNRQLTAPMERLDQFLKEQDSDFTHLNGELEVLARALLKEEFSTLREARIKELLDSKIWETQQALFDTATKLHAKMGDAVSDNFNQFDKDFTKACNALGLKLAKAERDQIINAITWKNPDAARVIKRRPKSGATDPLYGIFEVDGKLVEYENDPDLRDNENIPLDPDKNAVQLMEDYVKAEVLPHVPDAWISNAAAHRDKQDNEVGVVGYEIPFNYFFIDQEILKEGIELRYSNDIDFVNKDDDWDLAINHYQNRFYTKNNFTNENINKYCSYLQLKTDEINIEYLIIYLKEKINILGALQRIGFNKGINLEQFKTICLSLPSKLEQDRFINDRKFLQRIIEKKVSLLNSLHINKATSISNEIALERFKERHEQIDLAISQAPTFLSDLLYRSQHADEKSQLELLLKYAEYLALFLCSILFNTKSTTGKKIDINATFGYWTNQLEILSKDNIENIEIISVISQIVPYLNNLRKKRNKTIGHGSIPIKQELKKQIDTIFNEISIIHEFLTPFYQRYVLVKPIHCTYDGQKYNYKLTSYKGVVSYPYSTIKLCLDDPLIDGSLYYIDTESLEYFKVFPFIILEEIADNSGIEGFYLYANYLKDNNRYEYISQQQIPIQKKELTLKLKS